MCHMPPGISGLLVGLGIFLGIGTYASFRIGPGQFIMDPHERPSAFEPFIAKYIRAAEFIIGLATGSIVLLVGSSALHAQGGRLPWFYASPLLLLGWSVILGVAFIVWLIHSYEEYQHDNPHTKLVYSISETLGFGS